MPRDLGVHAMPRDGKWALLRAGAGRALRVGLTEDEAKTEARRIARAEGGVAYLHGPDGRIAERMDFSLRWGVFECRHVVPLNDSREHELWETCWCRPRIEEPDDQPGYDVIHNSADQREESERLTSSRATVN